MQKSKYEQEFEINATKNILYQYISSPSGLESWFADEVTINEDNIYQMVWDDELHYAIKVGGSLGKGIKFEFLDAEKNVIQNPNTLEFVLELNEFTDMMYLRVIDYSESNDIDDLNDLWEQLTEDLRNVVSGAR